MNQPIGPYKLRLPGGEFLRNDGGEVHEFAHFDTATRLALFLALEGSVEIIDIPTDAWVSTIYPANAQPELTGGLIER